MLLMLIVGVGVDSSECAMERGGGGGGGAEVGRVNLRLGGREREGWGVNQKKEKSFRGRGSKKDRDKGIEEKKRSKIGV